MRLRAIKKFKLLFFLISLITAIAGLCVIISNQSDKIEVSYMSSNTEALLLSNKNNTFSWDNANIYFLLTDRFNNGNTDNDNAYNRCLDMSGNLVNDIDTSATFHGGDFVGITEKINEGYFDSLGTNVLWISAPYEQIHGYVVGTPSESTSNSGFAHYAYHGYYALDYTNTDANFGTANEFKELVDTAHEHGIRIVLDISINHPGYASMYDMNEYNFGTLKSGWDKAYYSYNISSNTYSSFIDYSNNATDWNKWWSTKWVRADIIGYDFPKVTTNTTICTSNLPDFKTESSTTVNLPDFLSTKWTKEGRYNQEIEKLNSYFSSNNKDKTVSNYLAYWLSSWVEEYGIDGFRCDSAKHVDLQTWNNVKETCVTALNNWKEKNPDKKLDDLDFWMTGESWNHTVVKDSYYTDGGFDSMINFESIGGKNLSLDSIDKTYSSYARSINTDSSFNVLSCISSHDTEIADGDKIYLGSALLLLPGGVQTYYGDESGRKTDYSIQSAGNHNLRSDMDWNDTNATTLSHWQKVGSFRNKHISVGAGEHQKLQSTVGYAFSRVYKYKDSDKVIDKVAACIGIMGKDNVTIDVSSLWEDQTILTNTYDGSTSIVTDGNVTFNSGNNGTILIEEFTDKPSVSVEGNYAFYGTQYITVHLDNADYAKVSIDGKDKFTVYNNDVITIGDTAYEGDLITLYFEVFNKESAISTSYSFYKAYYEEIKPSSDDDSSDKNNISEKAIIHIYSYDDTAPYVYAWTKNTPNLLGEWPGKKATAKIDDYYTIECDTTDIYNVVLSNGYKTQSVDITNLRGEVWLSIKDADYKVDVEYANTYVDTSSQVNFHIKTLNNIPPYLYTWNDDGTNFCSSFPGTKLTEKDADGWYNFTVYGTSLCNAIISDGTNQIQTSDIKNLSDDVWITLNSSNFKDFSLTQTASATLTRLKKEARKLKNLTASDFISSTWEEASIVQISADNLITIDKTTNTTEIKKFLSMIDNVKSNLVLNSPMITSADKNTNIVEGVAQNTALVNVTLNGTTYSTLADDITGKWSITVTDTLKSGDILSITASKRGYRSKPFTYDIK